MARSSEDSVTALKERRHLGRVKRNEELSLSHGLNAKGVTWHRVAEVNAYRSTGVLRDAEVTKPSRVNSRRRWATENCKGKFAHFTTV